MYTYNESVLHFKSNFHLNILKLTSIYFLNYFLWYTAENKLPWITEEEDKNQLHIIGFLMHNWGNICIKHYAQHKSMHNTLFSVR